MAEEYSIVCIYHILKVYSLVDGHLGCFQFLAVVNSAVKDISVKHFCVNTCFQFFGV